MEQKDIFEHPWFSDLSFEQYRTRDVKAPWVPKIKDPLDSSNFEQLEAHEGQDQTEMASIGCTKAGNLRGVLESWGLVFISCSRGNSKRNSLVDVFMSGCMIVDVYAGGAFVACLVQLEPLPRSTSLRMFGSRDRYDHEPDKGRKGGLCCRLYYA